MLIEKTVEQKIADAVGALGPLSRACVLASRSSTASGIVKGTAEPDAPVIVAVSLGLRQHDAFSLPTVSVNGSVSVVTRAELCPTGAEHEDAIEAIAGLLTEWHGDGEAMTAALSVPERFFAAELRMDGGSGKEFDSARACWTETVSFTIRGSLLGNY